MINTIVRRVTNWMRSSSSNTSCKLNKLVVILPAQRGNQKRILNPPKKGNPRDSTSRWLEEETQVVEGAVQEVEEPAKEVVLVEAALHACPRGHQNLEGPVRNSRVTSSPSKDGDMLCTSKEWMATYIGTKYGDTAAQEWTSKKHIMSKEPEYYDAIEIRQAKSV